MSTSGRIRQAVAAGASTVSGAAEPWTTPGLPHFQATMASAGADPTKWQTGTADPLLASLGAGGLSTLSGVLGRAGAGISANLARGYKRRLPMALAKARSHILKTDFDLAGIGAGVAVQQAQSLGGIYTAGAEASMKEAQSGGGPFGGLF